MNRVGQEQDVETLRAQTQLLEAEVRRLMELNASLLQRINELQGGDAHQLQLALAQVNQQLDQARQKMFGDSSEKLQRPKLKKSKPVAQTGHGPREQPNLPRVEAPHELPQEERTCDSCGGELQEWEGQDEVSSEITVEARSYSYVIHRRKKYRCSCGGCIKTAPGALRLRPGALYSIDFSIDVALAKYSYHAPLERQVQMMKSDGLIIDSQTLWDQLEALATLVAPAHERLHNYVLSQPVVGADETHWRLMGQASKKKGGKGKRWQVWAVVTGNAVSYQLRDSRSAAAAHSVLGNFSGTVLCDGYAAYDSLKKQGGGFRLAHCWAHVRRKFYELKDVHPKECETILGYIGELYAIEAEIREGPVLERFRARQERSKPVVDKIRTWSYEVESLPQSALRKALVYMGGMWTGLQVFLDDPQVEIDNNRVERSLRTVVLGRKNHLGSRSERGTEVAALFYSLLESARLCSKDPRAYLRQAVESALAGDQIPLPHEV